MGGSRAPKNRRLTDVTIKRKNCGTGHSYTINGEKAIGVTTALKEGIPKPALVNWAAKTVARRVVDMDNDEWAALMSKGPQAAYWDLARSHETERGKAAIRGTAVHKIAEQLITGVDVAVPEHLAGYVEATVKFMDQWQPRMVLSEVIVGDYGYGYAGTFDLVADLPDGRRVLFDYKTSASGIWPETALQLAAYRWASHFVNNGVELPMSELKITDTMAVHLRSDGYSVVPVRTDLAVFSTFVYALQVARASREWKPWVGEPLRPGQPNPFAQAEQEQQQAVAA